MKRTSIMIIGLLLGISLLFSISAAEAHTETITFISDTTWAVSDPGGTFLGYAQNVCMNASAPLNCPAGATLYGYAGGGWTADLSSISGATWIWAPGITGETSPAFPAEYYFSKVFDLSGTPTRGTISVGVDDFAEVFVNGASVGTTGSTTDPSRAGLAQSSLKTFDVTSFLVTGSNVITVQAANGNFGCGEGPYSCNPSGVVFGGSLQFQSGVVEVSIDIKPGSYPNRIDPNSIGKIRVAILTTSTNQGEPLDFDASTIDSTTVLFGATGTEAAPVQSALDDVDGDGDIDMILRFNIQDTGIMCGDTSAFLTGVTLSGQAVEGSDSIKTMGCD